VVVSTCGTCRYWNRNGSAHSVWVEEDEDEVDLPHRKCLFVIHGNNRDDDAGEKMRTSQAAVLDGSGYTASLWTRADFGCTGWEDWGLVPRVPRAAHGRQRGEGLE
jgi:hypothetical protein